MTSPNEALGAGGVDRPADRRALQSVSTQFFANGVVYATFVPQLPEIRDRVGISIGGLGFVLDVGDAMAIVLVPAVIVGLAITFVGSSRPRRHARR